MQLVLIAALASTATAPGFDDSKLMTGRATAAPSGETVTIVDGNRTQWSVLLKGISAPGPRQPFGGKSRDALATTVLGKTVKIEVSERDRQGRLHGVLVVGDANVNVAMVRAGWAFHNLKEAYDDKDLGAAEADARRNRRGIWSDPRTVSPWDGWTPPKGGRKQPKKK
jgi:endonuclease YncB( thermonuclease family)